MIEGFPEELLGHLGRSLLVGVREIVAGGREGATHRRERAGVQAKAVRFAYRLNAERQLTGQELAVLAERMVESSDPDQTAMLREEIIRDFYGGKPHADWRRD